MPEVHQNSTAESAILLILLLSCVSGGYTIPRGVDLLIPIFYFNCSAEYFPNPLKFDPDNFLSERVKKKHPYSYIPFSAGPRPDIWFTGRKDNSILHLAPLQSACSTYGTAYYSQYDAEAEKWCSCNCHTKK